MKKFQTLEKNGEEYSRQRPRTAEARNFSESNSSVHKKDYYPDENMPVRYKKNSYQDHVERKSRTTSQTFVRTQKNQNFQNYDLEKTGCGIKLTDERLYLNETNKSPEQSNSKDNYKKLHTNVHPLQSNKVNSYPPSKNQVFKNIIPKRTDTRMKFKNEGSSVNDAEDFNTRDCDKIGVKEENISKNLDVKNTYFGIESSLPLNQNQTGSSYESNESFQHYNKQHNIYSNANFHELYKNSVYSHEGRPNFQSDNVTSNISQRATFLNDSASYADIGFNLLKLADLLYYNVNLMQVDQLSEYASAVKYKILDKIDKFPYPEKDELEFLSEITDGDQSEKNQRIITTRTCRIVRNAIEKFPLLLNALETQPPPPPQILVYQTVPNLHGITNSYCEPPAVEAVQNSEMLTNYKVPTTNYKVPDYVHDNVAQNDNCVISEVISDSYNIPSSNDYRENCELQNFNTNKNISKQISDSFNIQGSNDYNESCAVQNSNTNNNSPTNLFPITGRNKDIDSKSFEHCSPPLLNAEKSKTRPKIFFNEADSVFFSFGLDNLLKYDVDSMHGERVFDYGFSMKQKILENINQFMSPFNEKLKFLCELTDGTQLERNQKLINKRMCELIISAYEKTEYE